MQFKEADIQHIADLARLELTPAELASYGKELSAITAYIDTLQTVPLVEFEPVAANNNVWRQDEVEAWSLEENQTALAQGEIDGGLIKVKRVL